MFGVNFQSALLLAIVWWAAAARAEAFQASVGVSDGPLVGQEFEVRTSPAHMDGSCGSAVCWGGRSWFFGAEATFLHPDFSGGGVTASFDDLVGAATDGYHSSLAGLDGFYVGPRLTFGLQDDCWGVVGRFWQLNATSIAHDPLTDFGAGPALPGVLAEDRFLAYTYDLEVVRTVYLFEDVQTQFSLGARHASLDQDSVLLASDQLNGDSLSGYGASFRDFHGTGLSLAWRGWRPIWGSTHHHWFWSLRSSLLWGEIKNSAEAQAAIVGPGGSAFDIGGGQIIDASDMFIGEAQLGWQWTYRLQCVPAHAYFRVAGEYQYWDATSDPALASATATLAGSSQVRIDASAQPLRMDLIGFHLGAGFAW